MQQDVALLVTQLENVDVPGTEAERDYIEFSKQVYLLDHAKKLMVECTTAALNGEFFGTVFTTISAGGTA